MPRVDKGGYRTAPRLSPGNITTITFNYDVWVCVAFFGSGRDGDSPPRVRIIQYNEEVFFSSGHKRELLVLYFRIYI